MKSDLISNRVVRRFAFRAAFALPLAVFSGDVVAAPYWRLSGIMLSAMCGDAAAAPSQAPSGNALGTAGGDAAAAEPNASIQYRALEPGEVVLIAVEGNNRAIPPSGFFGRKTLSFFRASGGAYLAFAALDLGISTGTRRIDLELTGTDGRPHYWGAELLIHPKQFPVQELNVDPNYVNLRKTDAERAEIEADRLHDIFARKYSPQLFKGNFISPIPGALTSRFGERRVFNGVLKAPHSGADLRAPEGAPVQACAEGKIAFVGPMFYQGNTVILDHGAGLFSLYAHLSKILVREGESVSQGKILGQVGATGRVTGPHLHWGTQLGAARVDPFSIVALDFSRWLPRRPASPSATKAAPSPKYPDRSTR